MQAAMNQIVELYDRVDLYDLHKHRLTQLYCSASEPSFLNSFEPYETLVQRYASEMILPEERKLFEQFCSEPHFTAILGGAESSADHTILLHKRMPDGTRVLRLHHLIPFRLEEHAYVICCIQTIDENVIGAALSALTETAAE